MEVFQLVPKLLLGNEKNGIESFLGYAKTRLVKFKGMDKNMFELHLKECEFRFNNRGKNLYKILLEFFKNEPLKLS